MKFLRKILIITFFSLYVLGTMAGAADDDTPADVYVIKLYGEVNDAMVSYLKRELQTAEENNQRVIIDIDTLGGLVKSADAIVNTLLNSPVETTAFVSGKAISAGVLLTISCDNVAMAPSSYIGAAEPVDTAGNPISSEKVLSYVKGIMSTAAIEKGRPEKIILAMTDKRIVIDGYSQEGELLSLSSHQAVDLGVSDVLCSNIDEVIEYFGLGKTYETAPYTSSDKAAAILASSTALTIFFILGFVFMIIEVFTAGFGVPGFISIIFFVLYFTAGIIAGTAQWWAMGLFVLGIVALIIEIIIPGFGIFGISGIIMCFLGLIFSSGSIEEFTNRMGLVIIVCAILIPVCIKIFGKIKLYEKLTNKEVQSISEGYIINKYGEEIIGKTADVVTDLRPIGIVEVDGKRMDAFSDEGFIEKGSIVTVTGKKSSSVIVRKAKM